MALKSEEKKIKFTEAIQKLCSTYNADVKDLVEASVFICFSMAYTNHISLKFAFDSIMEVVSGLLATYESMIVKPNE